MATKDTNRTSARKGSANRSDDLGASQAQEVVDAENEQGFRGVEVDPTPNENYSVEGVTSGAPTPETDPEAAAKAREAAGLAGTAEAGRAGDTVNVTTADGRKMEVSRKVYDLQSDRFTLTKGGEK